jgi:hypothetical protein
MRPVYADEAAAFRRVDTLKAVGIWPGVITRADGTCVLTYDPEMIR